MKCPLMRIPITVKGAVDRGKIDECIKEECAWWNGGLGQCSVPSIAEWLNSLSLELSQIERTMPHAG